MQCIFSLCLNPQGLQAKWGMKNGKLTDFCIFEYFVISMVLSAGHRSFDKYCDTGHITMSAFVFFLLCFPKWIISLPYIPNTEAVRDWLINTSFISLKVLFAAIFSST